MVYKITSVFFWALFTCCISLKAQTVFPVIDVQHYNFNIVLNDANDTIKGQATVKVRFLKDVNAFQLNLVKTNDKGKGMLVSRITESGENILFKQDSDQININATAISNSTHSYTISYQGIPADGLIISTNKFGHRTFFGDNWPDRAHNWLPCADYPGDKSPVDFVITAPDHYQVVANGLKTEEITLPNHLKLTHWKETAQLPTKVLVSGAAEFAIDTLGRVNDIPVYTYVFPENKAEGFRNYAVAKEILPFYINKVGPYAYKKLANVQSKTIFGGMENAGAIFYFENSVTSAGIEELMAHEIAHQWFGDAASEKSFEHVWLSEGFATFMTNAYLEKKYGTDTLKKRLTKDREMVLNFEKTRLTPIVDTTVKSNYLQLLNANSYQKGGWVLQMLRRKLGEDIFWKGIRKYYAKYNGGNANTNDLRQVMEQVSGKDLKLFFKQWLYTPGHPQLNITWKYVPDEKVIKLHIEQKQTYLFEFPLEYIINNQVKTILIKNRIVNVQLKVNGKPSALSIDPNVNILAGFNVEEK